MTSSNQAAPQSTTQQRDAFLERLLDSVTGTLDVFSIYIGDRLGFYDALSADGALTSSVLASRTRTHERYAREWLEQQAVTGILDVDDARAEAKARRYTLSAGHAEVLTDRDSLNYVAPLARLVAGAVRPLPEVLGAFRRGGGVPFADYGEDLREGQAAINRSSFLRELPTEQLPAISDLHARLQADPPGRVADVGCGAGWSSIGIAKGYPKVLVDGLDLDEPSIELARANAVEAGFSDRVSFEVRDAADPALRGKYNLVTAFECLHDMSDPVGALRAMRGLASETGVVLIVDEKVAESFMGEGDDLDRMMYGWSILHCLPVGMVEQPSAETGTVMRPDTLRRYAREAGFSSVEILPVESFFFRFYRLHR